MSLGSCVALRRAAAKPSQANVLVGPRWSCRSCIGAAGKFVSYCCPVWVLHLTLVFLLRKQSFSSGMVSLFSVLLMLTQAKPHWCPWDAAAWWVVQKVENELSWSLRGTGKVGAGGPKSPPAYVSVSQPVHVLALLLISWWLLWISIACTKRKVRSVAQTSRGNLEGNTLHILTPSSSVPWSSIDTPRSQRAFFF